jgi:hypothetical protein
VGWQTGEEAQDEVADSARTVGIEHAAAPWSAPRKGGEAGGDLASAVAGFRSRATEVRNGRAEQTGRFGEVLGQESRKRDYYRDLCGGRCGRAAHACRGYPPVRRTGCTSLGGHYRRRA